MNIALFGIALFIMSVLVIEMGFYAFRILVSTDRKKFRKRLSAYSGPENGNGSFQITKNKILSDVPFLNRILSSIPGIYRMDLLMRQGNLSYSLGFFALFSLLTAFMGYTLASLKTHSFIYAVLFALVAGTIPFVYVRMKKNQRMDKFLRQLPDGLDLIARALRAGHAFASGLKLAADEFDDPLGPEFEETLDEINFGISVADALKNLAHRVDCPDLRFFVVSVILQRETGGNLSEIIGSIAHLIRERFKLQGKIKTLTAEGRMSAAVLIALPFLMAGALHILNPKYIEVLFTDPMGKAIAGLGFMLMCVAVFVIRSLIRLRV